MDFPELNLDGIDIGMNDDTGELEITKKEPVVDTSKSQTDAAINDNQQQTQNQQPDFALFQNQINSLTELVQRQSQALGLLLQSRQQELQPKLESLGEDQDKLVDTIYNRLKQPLDNLQNQVTPFIQAQQIEQATQNEWQQFLFVVPDAVEYNAGMQALLTAMPDKNWTFKELYVLAKGMGWKNTQQNQQQNQQQNTQQNNQQQNNVRQIRREVPPKLDSNNSNLQSKEIRPGKDGLKDALNAAMEELGFGT